MKLRIATSIAIVGSVLMLASSLYSMLLISGAIEVTLVNVKTQSVVMCILQILSALTFINFFVSFINAQRERG